MQERGIRGRQRKKKREILTKEERKERRKRRKLRRLERV